MFLPKKHLNVLIDGGVYIGQTCVRSKMIIDAFQQGDLLEQIVDSFDILDLADVYAVLAYCLNHRADVEAYNYVDIQTPPLISRVCPVI